MNGMQSQVGSEQAHRHSQAMSHAERLVARWNDLQPDSSLHWHAVDSLRSRIRDVLGDCMQQLFDFETAPPLGATGSESFDLVDVSYVLERLEWCVLHNVPYVERRSMDGGEALSES